MEVSISERHIKINNTTVCMKLYTWSIDLLADVDGRAIPFFLRQK